MFMSADTNSIGDCLSKIVRFAELEHGWDSYAALPINEKARETSIDILFIIFMETCRFPDAVVPISDGGIQFEYIKGLQSGIELEIDASGSLYFSVHDDEYENISVQALCSLFRKYVGSLPTP